jgi:FkbM family methyltransferase
VSRTVATALAGLANGATAWMKPYRRAMTRALLSERLIPSLSVETTAGPIKFLAPTGRSLHDPGRIYDNEPETIRWLDTLPADEVLWDIGANIGVYALYAAKARGMRVLAFEPSAASYAALARNIEVNSLAQRVDAYCLAFDAETRLDYLHMAATEAGSAMHAFGRSETWRGAFAPNHRQAVPGFAIDIFAELFHPPPPIHNKLDVDGNEPAILRGASHALSSSVRTLLVEIEDERRNRAIRELLAPIGFIEDTAFAAAGAHRNVLFRRRAR